MHILTSDLAIDREVIQKKKRNIQDFMHIVKAKSNNMKSAFT